MPVHADALARLQACADGDSAAWEEFVSCHERFLRWVTGRTLRRFGGARLAAEVDDCMAALYTYLLERDGVVLRRYDGSTAAETYLGVVASRFAGKYGAQFLRATRSGELEEDPQDSERAAPDYEPGHQERIDLVRIGMDKLLPRDRLMLKLYYEEGLSQRELAVAMGLAENSIGPTLQRARQRLEVELRHLVDDPETLL